MEYKLRMSADWRVEHRDPAPGTSYEVTAEVQLFESDNCDGWLLLVTRHCARWNEPEVLHVAATRLKSDTLAAAAFAEASKGSTWEAEAHWFAEERS